MSADLERNKAVLRRFWDEVWSEGKLDVIDEIFHLDFVDHGLAPGLTKQGPEGAKEAVLQFRVPVPDLHVAVDDLIAEGDKVVTRWTASGTQTGQLGPIPPTGKRAELRGMTINRLVDGRIIEAWDSFDWLGLLQQLGVPLAGGPPGPPGQGPGQASARAPG
jgi:predicted ester cyclase